ncbi:MAG: hypothetical protein D3906_10285 [Candidatus Electrothrix sp. AUS1_2]|nr:hypothetical protein [Candidatus Electrothrix sp. AUS1_2]
MFGKWYRSWVMLCLDSMEFESNLWIIYVNFHGDQPLRTAGCGRITEQEDTLPHSRVLPPVSPLSFTLFLTAIRTITYPKYKSCYYFNGRWLQLFYLNRQNHLNSHFEYR